MNYSNYKYVFLVALIIIFCFIASIILINYFKIDINDNSSLITLNKAAVYEGNNNYSSENVKKSTTAVKVLQKL
tara:strand:+ start:42 stop:263 length:222 start_codon:yes stop_codon:yes gene_type:complete